MVSKKLVEKQLKKLNFNYHGWGRGEINELHNILLPDEEVHELVNGIYEGGFALLVATDVRVLLVDKKPLNFLTVEDLRFDMINEMDYNHRLIGANINIATGSKNLKFSSVNQQRLRKLIGHVQHSMADAKKKQSSHQEDQKQHLEQINQQLQTYLIAQHQQQMQMQQAQQNNSAAPAATPTDIKPSPELSDYLFAQSLLAQYQAQTGSNDMSVPEAPELVKQVVAQADTSDTQQSQMNDLYAAGLQEVYGKYNKDDNKNVASHVVSNVASLIFEINPLKVAYSKLPMALFNRRIGRPSLYPQIIKDTSKLTTQSQSTETEALPTY